MWFKGLCRLRSLRSLIILTHRLSECSGHDNSENDDNPENADNDENNVKAKNNVNSENVISIQTYAEGCGPDSLCIPGCCLRQTSPCYAAAP